MSDSARSIARTLARRRLEASFGPPIPIRRRRLRLGARRALRRCAIRLRSSAGRAATLGAIALVVAVTLALAEGLSLASLAWMAPVFRGAAAPGASAWLGAGVLWTLLSLLWLSGVWLAGLLLLWRVALRALLQRLAAQRMLSMLEPSSDAPAYLRAVARPAAVAEPPVGWRVLPILTNWLVGLLLYLRRFDGALRDLARVLWSALAG